MAVGWAEELLFRGWLLRELEQGSSATTALVGTSLIFALAHFIKPLDVILATLPQFFGLLLLGLILGWARRTSVLGGNGGTTTSLGLPIGLHSGLVWGYYILSVGDLLAPTAAVPDWVTGRDGNPMAGMLGVILLGGLAMWFRHQAHRKKPLLAQCRDNRGSELQIIHIPNSGHRVARLRVRSIKTCWVLRSASPWAGFRCR